MQTLLERYRTEAFKDLKTEVVNHKDHIELIVWSEGLFSNELQAGSLYFNLDGSELRISELTEVKW